MASLIQETWFIFQNDHVILIQHADQSALPVTNEIQALLPDFVRQHRLGEFKNGPCYSAELDVHLLLPPPFNAVPLRKAFEVLGEDWYSAAVRAYSIMNWDKNHQFCGRCGATTLYEPGLFERKCSVCGLIFYPRISPSIIVLIKKDDHLLMARSPHFTPGVFGLIAGFVEAGETLEEAAHREIMEEVGLKVKNLTYYGSQSWPFPDSLMVGFFADWASGDIVIDHHEIEMADWYRFDQLPMRSGTTVSISKKLIDRFFAEMQGQLINDHR